MNQISNKSKAFLWMLGTTLSFCSMAICIKELSINHSTFDIQSLRNIFCIFILLIPFLMKKTSFIAIIALALVILVGGTYEIVSVENFLL